MQKSGRRRLVGPYAMGGAFCAGLVAYAFGLAVDRLELYPGPADLFWAAAAFASVAILSVAILTRTFTRTYFLVAFPVSGVGFATGWVLWQGYLLIQRVIDGTPSPVA